MFKIALNAGHGLYTAGKRCLKSLDSNETREWILNSRICNKIENNLKSYEGYELLRLDDVTGEIDVALKTRTDKANNFKADFYLSIHHNAGINGGSGGGIISIVYTTISDSSITKAWQVDLYNTIIKNTGLKGNRSNPLPKMDLHEVRESNMPAVLIECGFMDSLTDVPIILTEQFAEQVANACVEVIVNRGKLKKKQISVTSDIKKIYRVRKLKDDLKSQVGAYSILDNAKEACNKAGAGYKVFDWDYNVVYEYHTPTRPIQPAQSEEKSVETLVEELKVVAVYDLNYSEKNLIVDKTLSYTEKDCVKAIKKILYNNSSFNVEIAKLFWNLSPKYNIDPMMAISQSILETGWFKFTDSSVKASQHNYCGLGATGGEVSGATFDTIKDGVNAQLQHLYAYGTKESIPIEDVDIVDPRFRYVTRGVAPYWQQLAGRWAVPGYDKQAYDTPEKAMYAENTYGQKIRNIYNQILLETVTDEELREFFPNDNNSEITSNISTETDSKINEMVEVVVGVFKKLITLLFNLFNKKE